MNLALVFDFDDTLVPDSTSGLLDFVGVDKAQFWESSSKRVDDGFSMDLAYLGHMIQLERQLGRSIFTQKAMTEWGAQLPLFQGLPSFFSAFRALIKEEFPCVRLAFYAVSSGMETVISACALRPYLEEAWGAEFAHHEDGSLNEVKRSMSMTEKTRYLFDISKRCSSEPSLRTCEAKNSKDYTLSTPFKNMIYIGDGLTDLPCFSLLRHLGGQAFCVYSPLDLEKKVWCADMLQDRKIAGMFEADYRKDSPLWEGLRQGIGNIVRSLVPND